MKAKSPIETNNLYRAAQNLKIRNLRRCISAVLASKIYIKPTLDEYNNKRTELGIYWLIVGIEEKLTAEQSREMKNYTFMNWDISLTWENDLFITQWSFCIPLFISIFSSIFIINKFYLYSGQIPNYIHWFISTTITLS